MFQERSSHLSDALEYFFVHQGFRHRFERQHEESARIKREDHPAFLKKGIKIDVMPPPKWKKPLELHLEMDDAIIEQ